MRPENFRIKYGWREGTVPPPYYYEYCIHLGPGPGGKIIFYPEYPGRDAVVWTETFTVSAAALDEFHAAVIGKGLIGKKWTEIPDPPVGGSLEWLEITAGQDYLFIPSLIVESSLVVDLYEKIRGTVLETVWKDLFSRLKQRQQEYLDKAKR